MKKSIGISILLTVVVLPALFLTVYIITRAAIIPHTVAYEVFSPDGNYFMEQQEYITVQEWIEKKRK